MYEQLEDVLLRMDETVKSLSDPATAADSSRLQKLMKQQAELQPIADAYLAYKENEQTITESLELMESESDPEMKDMLREELNTAKKQRGNLEKKLNLLLLPKDPNDDRNVNGEIRAGAGGDEAAA